MSTTPHSIHRRVYNCEAFEDGPDRMRVRGHLNDTKPLGLGLADGEPMVIHDMSIELIVTLPTFTIVDVIAQMHVHPYDICPAVLADYRQLIGRSVTRGYSKAVRELFGGPQGCSHLGALLQAMGPVAVQASWGMATLNEPPGAAFQNEDGEADRQRRLAMNVNTCHVWAEDGPHMKAVMAGDNSGRPEWLTKRLVKLGVDPDTV
ncbi:MAG: DUF2889 domain-containing protein [Acidimicrobiia bacterium]|nr:DUF2889 domain-containing protein [Acidimicrobiia bacterium]MDH5290663.1 DUF2889 domain-containing protein [Acidimicrobiia bacterium]